MFPDRYSRTVSYWPRELMWTSRPRLLAVAGPPFPSMTFEDCTRSSKNRLRLAQSSSLISPVRFSQGSTRLPTWQASPSSPPVRNHFPYASFRQAPPGACGWEVQPDQHANPTLDYPVFSTVTTGTHLLQ